MTDPIPAFIPLKGHSARVPDKNMRDFGGRPLFHTIVATLQSSRRIGTITIDTDSDVIAESASGLDGVVVRRRRYDLVGDDVSVNLLIKDFLVENEEVRHVLQTHATNPLLTARTVDAAIERYVTDDAISSVFGVTRHQARFYWADMTPINHDPRELIPTQDLDPMFVENSNLYVFSREGFFEHDRRITDRAAMFEVDAVEAIDIDEERDFELALLALAARS